MDVSGISSNLDAMANMASGMQSNKLGLQFSTAILKETMDNQKMMGEAIVQMISSSTPSLEGTGRIVDIRA